MSGYSWIVAFLIVAMFASGGCTGGRGAAPPNEIPGPADEASVTPGPGLDKRPDRSAIGRGWVVRSDLEGGFWALADAPQSQDSKAKLLVVLLPRKVSESALAEHDGEYVQVTGEMTGGVSTRMSGPEMKVDTIRRLPETP